MSRTSAIRPGQPVMLNSSVGHVRSMKRGSWSGAIVVKLENPWDRWVSIMVMHRDSVTVLQGPPLSPEMMADLAERAVLKRPW